MGRMVQDSPTPLSSEVVEAVIREYSKCNEVPLEEVRLGFAIEGALVFDSIIGVEMSVGLEAALGIAIPEDQLLDSRLYRSLSSYAEAIQHCVDQASGGLQDG